MTTKQRPKQTNRNRWLERRRPQALEHAALPKLRDEAGITLDVSSVRIRCIDYAQDQYTIQDVTDVDAFIAAHRPEWTRVRWISVCGMQPDLIRALATKYQLHTLAVEDLLLRNHRAKLEDYAGSGDLPGRLFVIARALEWVDGRLADEQVSLFMGRTTILTFQEQLPDVFEPVFTRLQNATSRLRGGDVSLLMYALLDAVVSSYYQPLDHFSARLEELEDVLLERPDQRTLHAIHAFRRDLALLRRTAWPMRELVAQIYRDQHVGLSEAALPFFRDLHDQFVQIIDMVYAFSEIATSLTETYLSVISNRMNGIMKVLTLISTIFIPLTFLAGVYGMNMPIPENESPIAYPIFWLTCTLIAAGMLAWFKRNDWL